MLKLKTLLLLLGWTVVSASASFASELDLKTPVLNDSQRLKLMFGLLICGLAIIYGFYVYTKIKKLKVHQSMLQVSEIIYETCKTYLLQQGKFLLILFVLIGICISFYFGLLQGAGNGVVLIILWSALGILGSYLVAWFGIRINTVANSRMAYASLENEPLTLLQIPLSSGMSIGVTLISVELLLMLIILLYVPNELAGACFIGFAIGESLGASILRICGGIFTKIADVGSDLMKIFFKIKEDDPRNPGTIADCAGDNAGDSVGPSADGFETYGVTGVALISFIVLAVMPEYSAELITWIFVMRILMILTSLSSYFLNGWLTKKIYHNKEDFDFEKPLTNLIWITSILSIIVTFVASYWLLNNLPSNLWIVLAGIISFGTLGAALIPEVTKIFTSTKSGHIQEIVKVTKEGGASLTILSGLVAGNFSAFWNGLVFVFLMAGAHSASTFGLGDLMIYPTVFAFGLVAFGFLGMGPVTIAVDSYGPVTDNAQSIYELSNIERFKEAEREKQRNEFGFIPNFEKAKLDLEKNDGAGNTFKATAKPVLIGTAVVGATTMIFAIILLIKDKLHVEPESILNPLNPFFILGLILGGAVIFWFSGATIQAVVSGAYQAVAYIKRNIKIDEKISDAEAIKNSKEVVKICTKFAQKGMINIFAAVFSLTLAFAFWSAPSQTNTAPVALFISYLISIAIFGLFQAMFMANSGGAWDNAKKIVETEFGAKGTDLHAAVVIADTVGDPYKDTSSVSLNPIIKFTTLFGLLAMEISLAPSFQGYAPVTGTFFFFIALIFVYRSFYKMRIK